MSDTITGRFAHTTIARVAGACYLGFMLLSFLADRMGHIGLGEPAQMVKALATHGLAFRGAIAVVLISALLFLVSAWGLYVVLRPVHRGLALLFLLLNAVGVAMQCASMFPLLSALLMGDSGSHMQAYSAAQIEGLGLVAAGTYKTGFATAQLFFGTWLFPLGYLVYRSRLLPRVLGVLLLADGVAEMVWFFQALLAPSHHGIIVPGLVVSLAAELGLALWLIVRGVRHDPSATARLAGEGASQ